jgi:hypothetical protein
MSNSDVDVYLLAESSLLVYTDRIMLKSCGATTPLLALPQMFREYKNALMPVPSPGLQSIMYQRKTLRWPTEQHWPHRTLREENLFVAGFEHIFGCKNWQRRVAGIPCSEANSVEQVVLDRADGQGSGRVVHANSEEPPVYSESSPASVSLLSAGSGASPSARAAMTAEAVSAAMDAARVEALTNDSVVAAAAARKKAEHHHLDGRDNAGQWVELWMDSIGEPAANDVGGESPPNLECMFCEECGGSGLNMTRSSGLGEFLQILKAKQTAMEHRQVSSTAGKPSGTASCAAGGSGAEE